MIPCQTCMFCIDQDGAHTTCRSPDHRICQCPVDGPAPCREQEETDAGLNHPDHGIATMPGEDVRLHRTIDGLEEWIEAAKRQLDRQGTLIEMARVALQQAGHFLETATSEEYARGEDQPLRAIIRAVLAAMEAKP